MFNDRSTILFQGDSITDGGRSHNEDLNHILGHGYAYLIASRLGADYPEKGFTFINRGISGNRVIDLYSRWKEDVLNLKPDILSILIGVNDVGAELNRQSGAEENKFEKIFKLILEETKEKIPNIRIILCEPFILNVGDVGHDWEYWNKEVGIRRGIVKKVSALYHCDFVELQKVFDEACKKVSPDYWLWDGVHPTAAGHELIKREWLKVAMGKQ